MGIEPTILSEKHRVATFKMSTEPAEWRKPGIRHVRTHARKPLGDDIKPIVHLGKSAILLTIEFSAKQLYQATVEICEIQIISEFILPTITGPFPDDFWCDLFQKSVTFLVQTYTDKIKGTYLEKQPLSIPANIREDCMKQRKIDRISRHN